MIPGGGQRTHLPAVGRAQNGEVRHAYADYAQRLIGDELPWRLLAHHNPQEPGRCLVVDLSCIGPCRSRIEATGGSLRAV